MTNPAGLTGCGLGLTFAPLGVDRDQARRGDLVEEHPVGVDEKVVGVPRQARRDVGEDDVIPPEQRDQAVAGGEIDPELQLADVRACARGVLVHAPRG